jgi:hypothetical protein
MAAQAELSLLPAHQPHSRVRIYAPEACAALLVVIVGTAGLIAHSWLRQTVESWINIHVLFGLLLCGWIMIRCQRLVSQSPPMRPADIRRASRTLSRIVCCVLWRPGFEAESQHRGRALARRPGRLQSVG